jgi:hypothetical protein
MISAARIHNFRVEVWKTIEVICDRLKAMGFWCCDGFIRMSKRRVELMGGRTEERWIFGETGGVWTGNCGDVRGIRRVQGSTVLREEGIWRDLWLNWEHKTFSELNFVEDRKIDRQTDSGSKEVWGWVCRQTDNRLTNRQTDSLPSLRKQLASHHHSPIDSSAHDRPSTAQLFTKTFRNDLRTKTSNRVCLSNRNSDTFNNFFHIFSSYNVYKLKNFDWNFHHVFSWNDKVK